MLLNQGIIVKVAIYIGREEVCDWWTTQSPETKGANLEDKFLFHVYVAFSTTY